MSVAAADGGGAVFTVVLPEALAGPVEPPSEPVPDPATTTTATSATTTGENR